MDGWTRMKDGWMDKKDERLKINFLPFHFMNPSA